MCGRFALYENSEFLQNHFDLASPPEVIASYNISPQRMILAIINEQAGPAPVYLKWGLVPHWSQMSKTDFKMINARIEGVWERQAFKSAIRYRRCLIPASGFFEWKRDGSKKVPYFISVKDNTMFAMAGIWDTWEDNTSGEIIESCAVLTTKAQGIIADIHDRMPVLIDPSGYESWLDPTMQTKNELEIITMPASSLTAWQVSKLVNNPRNNSPELISPYEE